MIFLKQLFYRKFRKKKNCNSLKSVRIENEKVKLAKLPKAPFNNLKSLRQVLGTGSA